MKALSIRQPFVDAILAGHKTVEVRGHAIRHRGDLLLHASRRFGRDERERLGLIRARGIDLPDPEPASLGALVGIAQLVDCRRMTDADWEAALTDPVEGDYWAWELAEPERFPAPLPYRGRLFVFDVSDEELAALALEARQPALTNS